MHNRLKIAVLLAITGLFASAACVPLPFGPLAGGGGMMGGGGNGGGSGMMGGGGGNGGSGGMMGGGGMPVTPEQARTAAQQFLNSNRPGLSVADAHAFYGYYNIPTLKDRQVEGMLSVNGFTGVVQYHTWHGSFIGMKEYK